MHSAVSSTEWKIYFVDHYNLINELLLIIN